MQYFYNCKTYSTGLYKPHTIAIENRFISIVYYEFNTNDYILSAIAFCKNKHKYEIYKTDKGYLARPVNASIIKGIYPWF